jgi:hypothetical protein
MQPIADQQLHYRVEIERAADLALWLLAHYQFRLNVSRLADPNQSAPVGGTRR